MAKTKPLPPASPPASPTPAQPASPTGPTPAHVLTAALGMGTTAAKAMAAKLSDTAKAELVQIYTSNSTDKAAQIRRLLPTN